MEHGFTTTSTFDAFASNMCPWQDSGNLLIQCLYSNLGLSMMFLWNKLGVLEQQAIFTYWNLKLMASSSGLEFMAPRFKKDSWIFLYIWLGISLHLSPWHPFAREHKFFAFLTIQTLRSGLFMLCRLSWNPSLSQGVVSLLPTRM